MTEYRRRAMTRDETIEILTLQGADMTAFVLPQGPGSRREKAIWNAIETQKISIPCGNPQCRSIITARQDCVRDHKISLRSVASPEQCAEHDRPWNQWYLCHGCNTTKTSKRGLTGLGSDAARIAKLRRVEKGKKECRSRPICSQGFPKPSKTMAQHRAIPARPFPSAMGKVKMASRPFPKGQKQKGLSRQGQPRDE